MVALASKMDLVHGGRRRSGLLNEMIWKSVKGITAKMPTVPAPAFAKTGRQQGRQAMRIEDSQHQSKAAKAELETNETEIDKTAPDRCDSGAVLDDGLALSRLSLSLLRLGAGCLQCAGFGGLAGGQLATPGAGETVRHFRVMPLTLFQIISLSRAGSAAVRMYQVHLACQGDHAAVLLLLEFGVVGAGRRHFREDGLCGQDSA